ncbi:MULTISPECIES: hypothetical protein [Streptomycetaceae]|uniref:hypothetical protein n=1 Tax=Streptomycetaceae TaxID=2062 RepID=UPI00093E24AF|nr:hypothetical protein [Streptomyces sp. CB02056]OKH97531.1 hypothetical protein AMK13_38110 [Streptomyces sp. CB02056]
MDTIMHDDEDTLDDLYHRYSARLLAAATERLAAIGPDATQLDEDVAQEVWAAVAAGHYPTGHYGLDGLLVLLDRAVSRVRAVRAREWPAGLPQARPRIQAPDVLEDLATNLAAAPTPLRPRRPATTNTLLALEVA